MADQNNPNTGSRSGNSGSMSGGTSGNSGSKDTRSSDFVTQASDSGSTDGIVGILRKVGMDEALLGAMVDQWRGQLTEHVTHTIQDTDLRDAFEKARELTGGSAEKLRDYAKRNPKLFYSGLAAVLIGSGLIAAAAKEMAVDADATAKLDRPTGL